MKSLFFCTPLLFTIMPSLTAQTTYLVDGQGVTSAPPPIVTVSSITSAASSASSGDTIAIWGMEDPVSGKPVAYSETNIFTAGGESFPISIQNGVTVIAHPNSPRVVIGSESAAASTLLQLGSVASGGTTTLEDLSFAGGAPAIKVDSTSSGLGRDVVISDVVFESSSIGIHVKSSHEATVKIAITDCKVLDLVPSSYLANSPPIIFRSQSTGIRFEVGGGGNSSIIDANVNNLANYGQFDTMAPAVTPILYSRRPYLEANTGTQASSKMIEVIAKPGAAEHSGSGVPRATIRLNGCQLDGKASGDTTGWDWGLYCLAEGASNTSSDYHAVFDVQASGTVFDSFRLGGILAFTNLNCRGLVKLNGNTRVTDSGKQTASGIRPYLHSGVSLESFESYLGFIGSNFTSTRNQGHGLFLYSEGAIAAPKEYDNGLFLGLEDCEISSNSHNGLTMRASSKLAGDIFGGGVQQSTIVGGTWHYNNLSTGFSLIAEGDEKMFGKIPIGQGYINRCTFSNNSEHAIYSSAEKHGGSTVISNCLVNTYIWNSPKGGVVADMEPDPEWDSMPDYFFPIVHSNLFHNGNSAGSNSNDFSFEIDNRDSTGVTGGLFEWSEPSTVTGGLTLYLRTRLLSSVFDRDGTGTNDFGPIINPQLVQDSLPPTPPSPYQIGVGGIRAVQNALGFPSIDFRFQQSTTTPPPYIGGSNMPAKWHLDSAHTDFPDFDFTLSFISVDVPEATSDYDLEPRPGGSQLFDRDKGADQAE